MSYTKYTWVTGEVITADKLNHMEDGIAGAFPVADLVEDGTKYIVKATPETIESVFVAVGNNMVIYRVYSEDGNDGAYSVFMGNLTGQTITAKQFDYDETAAGYVWDSNIG